jgi:hypothetical protein
MNLLQYYSPAAAENSDAAINDLSIAGIQRPFADPFDGSSSDEPFEPTFEDVAYFVDDDHPDEEDLSNPGVMRLSESCHTDFWAYFDRFVRYWPKKSFHVKYAYPTGFVEKKKKSDKVQSLPLFEQLAIEMTERHLSADQWAEWRRNSGIATPIWLALHMPKFSTVDAIDIDAKKYLLGYYREWETGPQMPVVHLPLAHFQMLKRVYDQFPGRIWCISSETLGIHAWKKHDRPQPTDVLHRNNKELLAAIGHGDIESHPMTGRCFRRPFGADYRTVTPDGLLTNWIDQLRYFETDGRTPDFSTICRAMLDAMLSQWRSWEKYGPKKGKVWPSDIVDRHRHEVIEVKDWLAAGCPLEPVAPVNDVDPTRQLCQEILSNTLGDALEAAPDPIMKLCRAILLVTFGEKSKDSLDPILKELAEHPIASEPGTCRTSMPRPRGRNKREDLASLRNGNWAKEVLRLARIGLEQEDSVAKVVHEMAKWLWWIELYSLPESSRQEEITRLLTAFVLRKHNGCVSRLETGNEQDVISQIARCVELAQDVAPESVIKFAATREKWLNGGYRFPIRIVPALAGEEDVSSSLPCLITSMCPTLDVPLPQAVQAKIMAEAGRSKVLPFATRLLNRLHTNNGKAYLGRTALQKLLGNSKAANSSSQLSRYLSILEQAGVITRGSSYSAGRNGKLITLDNDVIAQMSAARTNAGNNVTEPLIGDNATVIPNQGIEAA